MALVTREVKVVYSLNDGTERRAIVNLEGRSTKKNLPCIAHAGKFVKMLDGVSHSVE
jgi:hypothetical protein